LKHGSLHSCLLQGQYSGLCVPLHNWLQPPNSSTASQKRKNSTCAFFISLFCRTSEMNIYEIVMFLYSCTTLLFTAQKVTLSV
jgi:hypothetical protein